jgi:hypothetical protein
MPNVTDVTMRTYLRAFRESLDIGVHRHLDAEAAAAFVIPLTTHRRYRGFVSTSYGAGFEVCDGDEAESVEVHSKPVDLMLWDLSRARAAGEEPVLRVTAPDVKVIGAGEAIGRRALALQGHPASVTIAGPLFRAPGWRHPVTFAELSSERSIERWSEASAGRRASELVFLAREEARLAQAENLGVMEHLAGHKKTSVLVLGDYSVTGRVRLAAIKDGLRRLGYAPFLVEEASDLPGQTLMQKVMLLAGSSRFVVADDSSHAGHIAEIQQCEQQGFVTAVIRMEGTSQSAMARGGSITRTTMREATYTPANLDDVLHEAARWAEATIGEVDRALNDAFGWRSEPPDIRTSEAR